MGKNSKSFFEKIGLIESCESENLTERISPAPTEVVPKIVEVSDEPVSVDENLITDIYNSNSMDDFSSSIYKVKEFLDALPIEMLESVKKTTVLSLLGVSKLPIEVLQEDATKRIDILSCKKDKIIEENTGIIESSRVDIEKLKEAIANASTIIDEKEKENKVVTEVCDNEIKVINDLVKFIGGNE